MKINLTPISIPRSCGSCTLCCKVLAIKELDKPANTWCQHAMKSVGCKIYATRPISCQTFICAWISSSALGPELRPDKIHGVLTATTDGKNLVLFEDPGYSGYAANALKHVIDNFINDRVHFVIVVTGDRRRLIGDTELIAGMGSIHEISPGEFEIKKRD